MITLSIIIPVYNVEKYINRCLSSIYSQQIDNSIFEVIIINDGSTDNSLDVIKGNLSTLPNMHLIDQKNGGVSSARNAGINLAKGKYISFVDPDDILLPNSLQKVIHYCENENEPVVICRSFEKSKKELYGWKHLFKEQTYEAINVLNQGYFRGSVCGCLFKSEFIEKHNIRFIQGMNNSEDTTFFSIASYYAKTVRFQDIHLYNVIGRESSASKVFSVERIKKEIDAIRIVDNHITGLLVESPILQYLRYQLRSNMFCDAIRTNISYDELLEMGFESCCRISTSNLSFQKWKCVLLNISPKLFFCLLKFKW